MEGQEDMLMMRAGRMMIRRRGETRLMKEEVTTADGTKVMPNGQVLRTDGTARMMMDGETIILTPHPAEDPEDLPDREFKEAMEDEELSDEIPEDE